MFLRVINNKTKQENLALIATNGIRIYDTKDDTGNSDKTIPNEIFMNTYTIIGVTKES